MNLNPKEIIAFGKIGNQDKQITLHIHYAGSTIYHVWIDKEYVAQVVQLTGQWRVVPHEESWLKGEDCDVILQTVLNVENINP